MTTRKNRRCVAHLAALAVSSTGELQRDLAMASQELLCGLPLDAAYARHSIAQLRSQLELVSAQVEEVAGAYEEMIGDLS